MRFIPTLLSLARALVTPWIVIAVMHNRRSEALALCFAAGFSDFLDGFLARRFEWTSRTGAWLDGISDKILLSSLYIAFGVAGWVPAWLVKLVLGRDILILLMAALGLLLTPIKDFPPSIWGKLSTNIQILTAFLILASPESTLSAWMQPMIAICATVTAGSGFHYFVSGIARFSAFSRHS